MKNARARRMTSARVRDRNESETNQKRIRSIQKRQGRGVNIGIVFGIPTGASRSGS
jgi:hypothetical protein